MSAPITEAVDISPEAVEDMAEWCENGGRRPAVRPSQMFRALSSALTARDKDAERYRWLRARTFTPAMPYATGTQLDKEIDAALEKANG